MSKKNLIDYDFKDIIDYNEVLTDILKRVEKNKNYARTALWLGICFLKQDRSFVTSKKLNDEVLKKTHGYATKILDFFTVKEILVNHPVQKFEGKKYTLRDKEFLIQLVSYTKNIMFKDKEKKK